MYSERLWTTLIPEPQKILNFSDPDRKRVKRQPIANQQWPVKARKQPSIGGPLMILDMPTLLTDLCHHSVDWGKTGFIASIYHNEVYAWNAKTNIPRPLTCTGYMVAHSIKWNRAGDKLALALIDGNIAIWDCDADKISSRNKCICASCVITCIDWSMDDQKLLAGCTTGRLCQWSFSLSLEKVYTAHYDAVVTIVFSPGNNHFATTGLDGLVRVWHWPLQENFEVRLNIPARGIAWHPWRHSLLAIGDSAGYLSLYNVNTVHSLGNKLPPRDGIMCDAVTWNKISGELVVSYWLQPKEENCNGKNAVMVFSDLETMVDGIEWHMDRVPYLMWGPDDSELATAGSDENLCVWNFLNYTKKESPKKSNFFGPSIR